MFNIQSSFFNRRRTIAAAVLPTSPAPRRRYVSTYVVALLTVAALALAIAPGQYHVARKTWTHGWPWTYETREAAYEPLPPLPKVGQWWRVPVPNRVFRFEPWSLTIAVRHFSPWLLLADVAVAVGIFAAAWAFWNRWRRQRNKIYQWHIRDLLALTAAAALACAWFIVTTRAYQNERAVAERLSHFRFGIQFTNETVLPSWLVKCLGQSSAPSLFDRPVMAELQYPSAAEGSLWQRPEDNTVEELEALPTLEAIRFQDCALSERGIAALRAFPKLKVLNVSLAGSHDPRASDLAIAELVKFADLESLEFFSPPLGNAAVTEDGIEQLGRLPHLVALNLGLDASGDRRIITLAKLTHLRELHISWAGVTSTGFRTLIGTLSHLENLSIGDGDFSTGERDMQTLAQLTNLKELNLVGTPIDDSVLKAIAELPVLRKLAIDDDGTKITEQGLAYLQSLTHLEELRLRSRTQAQKQFPRNALKAMLDALPNLWIEFK